MAASPIRIFIVDDNALFCDSLNAVLNGQKDFQVIGKCASTTEARSLISRNTPDLILVEMYLMGQSSMDLLRDLPSLSLRSRAIVSAESETQHDVVEAMRLGAKGFLLKQSSYELYLKCLRKVYQGEIWLEGRFAEAVLTAFGKGPIDAKAENKAELSTREMEVIELVVQGYKNKDIAQKLFISEKTVKNHLSAIFNKLGVADRLELTLYAFEKRLFSPITE